MKKEFRLLAGIILHPVKKVLFFRRRRNENEILVDAARGRQFQKNHERMHRMSELTNTAYTSSPLYLNLYAGAPEHR